MRKSLTKISNARPLKLSRHTLLPHCLKLLKEYAKRQAKKQINQQTEQQTRTKQTNGKKKQKQNENQITQSKIIPK